MLKFEPVGAQQVSTGLSGKEVIECLDPAKGSPSGEPNAAVTAQQVASLAVLPTCTFAQLPAANKSKGIRGSISDGNTTFASANYGANAAGGGANFQPVVSDGANWRVG